jgi:hypothetical protein
MSSANQLNTVTQMISTQVSEAESESILSATAFRIKAGIFLAELKRRDVCKVAVAYAVVSWLLIQAASILLPTFEAPAWMMKAFVVLLGLGFILAAIIAWIFEMTPEGIKRTDDISQKESHDIRRQLAAQAQQAFVRGYLCALSYAGLADKPNAIDHLNRVYLGTGNGNSNGDRPRVPIDPLLASLLSDVSCQAFADETSEIPPPCESSRPQMQPVLGRA